MSKVFNGDIIKNEPALITGLVNAMIALLVAFGLNLSDDQIGSVLAVVSILLAIVARKFVIPTNKLIEVTPAEDQVTQPPTPPPDPPLQAEAPPPSEPPSPPPEPPPDPTARNRLQFPPEG